MDLFGAEQPMPEKKKRPETDGSVVRLEAACKAAHLELWGCELYRVSVPRERKLLKELVAQLTEDVVLALVRQFYSTKGRRGNYTIVDFHRDVPALRLESQRHHVNQRTVENLEAAARAAGAGRRK